MYQLSYLGHSISIGDVFKGDGNSAMVTGFRFKPNEFPRIELLRASGGRIVRDFNELLTNAPTVPYGGVNVNEFTGRVSVNGEYAYSGYFTGAGVCYTCGVNCECGDSDE